MGVGLGISGLRLWVSSFVVSPKGALIASIAFWLTLSTASFHLAIAVAARSELIFPVAGTINCVDRGSSRSTDAVDIF